MRPSTLTHQLEELVWDSKHFGVKMGRLDIAADLPSPEIPSVLGAALEDARKQKPPFQQLMTRAEPSEIVFIQALKDAGFYLVDTLVTLELDLKGLDLQDPPKSSFAERHPWVRDPQAPEIREAMPEVAEIVSLKGLAREAFADHEVWLDRFHADPRLKDKADSLYAKWVENSVPGPDIPQGESMADCTLVSLSYVGDIITGFITCIRGGKTRSEPGKVSLNAVAKAFRGRGIYKHLVHHALKWFKEQGEEYVTVRTSASSISGQRVQQIWARLGAKQVKTEHTFHWWAI